MQSQNFGDSCHITWHRRRRKTRIDFYPSDQDFDSNLFLWKYATSFLILKTRDFGSKYKAKTFKQLLSKNWLPQNCHCQSSLVLKLCQVTIICYHLPLYHRLLSLPDQTDWDTGNHHLQSGSLPEVLLGSSAGLGTLLNWSRPNKFDRIIAYIKMVK